MLRKTNDAEADGEIVWSWHPMLVSSLRRLVGPTGRDKTFNPKATVAISYRRGERV